MTRKGNHCFKTNNRLFSKVAQQDAQRAVFRVEQAKQERQQKIVLAEGEAESAKLIGTAFSKNPGYLKLRKITAARAIAKSVREKVHRDSTSKVFFRVFSFQQVQIGRFWMLKV